MVPVSKDSLTVALNAFEVRSIDVTVLIEIERFGWNLHRYIVLGERVNVGDVLFWFNLM